MVAASAIAWIGRGFLTQPQRHHDTAQPSDMSQPTRAGQSLGALEMVALQIWGTSGDRLVRIDIAPGRSMRVRLGASEETATTHEAWDMLALKMNDEQAFETLQAFLPAIRRVQLPPAQDLKDATLPPPAEGATVEFEDAAGRRLQVQWQDGECRRRILNSQS